jgi:hypothetical protein
MYRLASIQKDNIQSQKRQHTITKKTTYNHKKDNIQSQKKKEKQYKHARYVHICFDVGNPIISMWRVWNPIKPVSPFHIFVICLCFTLY